MKKYRSIFKKAIVLPLIAMLVIGNMPSALLANAVGTSDSESQTESIEASDCLTEIDEDILSYRDEVEHVESLSNDSNGIVYASSLPDSYDGREFGYLTDVRNQGNFGSCWAFAAINSAEVSAVKNNLASADTLNLSEEQLAYFFFHNVEDALGGTKGDSNTLIADENYLNAGGNTAFTMFALANWIGASDETIDASLQYPEDESLVVDELDEAFAYDDYMHLQNAYQVSMQDSNVVKQLIMQYGTLAVSYYHDSKYINNVEGEDNAYCQKSVTNNANHAVSLVGWDDDYSKDNFKSASRVVSDGAWLVKNSWGTSDEDSGYLWISYEDLSIKNSDAFVLDFETADNYNHNYQYDGTAVSSTSKVNSGGSLANVFTAKGNESGSESLEAVSIALNTTNVSYKISIYTDLTDTTNPTSGTLAETVSGSTTYSGYYTIPLTSPVLLDEGEQFSVVFTLTKSSSYRNFVINNYISYYYDTSEEISNFVNFESASQAGQSYVKNSATGSWTDVGAGVKNTGNLRIKAFTNDVEDSDDGSDSSSDISNPSDDSDSSDDSNSSDISNPSGDSDSSDDGNSSDISNPSGDSDSSDDGNSSDVSNPSDGNDSDSSNLSDNNNSNSENDSSTTTITNPKSRSAIQANDSDSTSSSKSDSKKTIQISDTTSQITTDNTVSGNTASTANTAANNSTKQTFKKSRFTKGSLKYVTTGTKTVTVTGAKSKRISAVKIPSYVTYKGTRYKVTQVQQKAFYNCKRLKRVVIGNYVTAIGKKAFYNCKRLANVKIFSKGNISIGMKAFAKNNKKLKIQFG